MTQSNHFMSMKPKNYLLRLATLLAVSVPFFAAVPARSAEVQYLEKVGGCLIKGTIDSDTPSLVEKAIASKTCVGYSFDSSGGDVEAAMSIGELLRAIGAMTIVSQPDTCSGACVLAFLGGAVRAPVGKIGINRPYLSVGSTTVAEATRRRTQLDEQLRTYLKRMNVPAVLLDEMNATPPGQIRWLADRAEKERLQIAGKDPVWAEVRDTQQAAELGIPLSTYYQRVQRSDAVCVEPKTYSSAGFVKWYECKQAVMNGTK